MTRTVALALALAALACQREPVAPAPIVPVHVPAALSLPAAATADPHPSPVAFRVGDLVDVEWQGRWYPASVIAVPEPGAFTIHYDGYGAEWDETVGSARIRARDAEAVDPAP